MTHNNGETSRARRRAVRSAGPPVEETGAAPKTATPGAVTTVAIDESPVATDVVKSTGADTVSTQVTDKIDAAEVESAKSGNGVAAKGAEPAKKAGMRRVWATVADDSAEPTDKVDLGKSWADDAVADSDQPTVRVNLDKGRELVAAAPRSSGNARTKTVLTWLSAACAVVAIAALVAAVVSVFAMRSADNSEDQRSAYVQTARQAVLNLTTIRQDSAKEDIDRILAVASGQFKSEFDGKVDPFLDVVKQAKVVSNGEVVEAALEKSDDNSAQVLVAAKQTLTNAGQDQPQLRYYRFRITVTNGDSGMTVSNVEFVA